MNYYPTNAQQLLRTVTGNTAANFRNGQEDAIRHIVEGRSRLLAACRTLKRLIYIEFML